MKVKPMDRVSKAYGQVPRHVFNMTGISKAMIDRALSGDKGTLEKIANMGMMGEQISLLSPALQNRISQHIQGVADYNGLLSSVYQQGAQTVGDIRGQQYNGLMADRKLGNKLYELEQKYHFEKSSEKIRHKNVLQLMSVTNWIALNIGQIDHQARLEDQYIKPVVKQIQTDREYELKSSQHILTTGTQKGLPPKKVFDAGKITGFVRSVFS